jgi:hypothetical protein
MNKIIKWLKPSFEGADGKSSARALTNGWYVFLNTILSLGVLYLVYIVVKSETVNSEAVLAIKSLIWLIVIYNITILLIFGIVTIQNVTQLTRAFKGVEDKTAINDGDSVVINKEND